MFCSQKWRGEGTSTHPAPSDYGTDSTKFCIARNRYMIGSSLKRLD